MKNKDKIKFADEAALSSELRAQNEMETNRLLAMVLLLSGGFYIILAVLDMVNVGYYLANGQDLITYAVLFLGILPIAAALVCARLHFYRPWLKPFMMIVLCLSVNFMYFLFSNSVSVLVVLPIFVAIRYYDRRFTDMVTVTMWALVMLSAILNVTLDSVPAIHELHEVQGQTVWHSARDIFLYIVLSKTFIFFVIFYLTRRLSDSGYRLFSEQSRIMTESQVYASELATAATIQQQSLSKNFAVPGNIKLYACMDPARVVGGDFYDFVMVDENTLAVLIADVSDKGMPAALCMMAAKKALRLTIQAGYSPAEALRLVNESIYQDNDSCYFLTLWLGTFDVRSGVGKYVNAGHNPPLIRYPDGTVTLLRGDAGPFIGVFEDVQYREHPFTLTPGSILLLYTDGATDIENPQGKMLGTEALSEFVSKSEGPPENFCAALSEKLNAYKEGAAQFDDITFMALSLTEAPAGEPLWLELPANQDSITSVIDRIDAALEDTDCPPDTRMLIETAADEILSNIVNYAYRDLPGEHRLRCGIELLPKMLRLDFADEGVAFNPLEAPAPELGNVNIIGGLGIHLVKNIADELSYRRSDTENILSFIKTW